MLLYISILLTVYYIRHLYLLDKATTRRNVRILTPFNVALYPVYYIRHLYLLDKATTKRDVRILTPFNVVSYVVDCIKRDIEWR